MATENFKSNLIIGLVAGVGASLLAPVLRPFLANVSRSLTKATIKGSIHFYEKGRESFAELGETMDDLVAEAKSEMETDAQGGAAITSAAAQGRAAPLSAQPKPSPDSQSPGTTSATQSGEAGKAPSPPAPPATKASQGSQRSEGAQGQPPTQGE
ncbi:DUF5132 domain-containing protein [Nitrosovibrio sp. Nv6]|uniref:DUF5132 domain-containing protein n=1 Tax=Nitrosovibrio sp. Nv6 TaxID=1855340 RepID=UPI0008D4D651|nr:DUF5132 domain-containing protein [Nitrosovibrio sp. Nv6]SEO44323.1 protein of unknown function [Nitrosovibrio sp. Nv6]